MNTRNFAVKVLLVATFVLGGIENAKAASFVNGSFETGDLTGWSGTATTDGFGYNPFGTIYGSGMDGSNWMWLAGFETPRDLSQTVTGLTNGQTYAVDFIMASEASLSDSLFVSADGGTQVQFTAPPYNPSGFNGGFWTVWVAQEFTFTASGTSATITFSTFGIDPTTQFDVGLDNVTISTVGTTPEPASMTLLGIGIAGMAGYRWRRRKQAATATAAP